MKRRETKGVTVQTAADILGISISTLRNWDRSGKLASRRGQNGYRYYNISELEQFAQKTGMRRKKRRL